MAILLRSVFILLLAAPLILKGLHVEQFVLKYTSTRYLGFFQVLANDAIIYGGLVLLLYLSVLPKTSRWLAAGFRLLAVSIFVVYLIDYLIITNFNTHLATGDFIKYASYASKYIQQVYGLGNASLTFITLILCSLLFLFAFNQYRLKATRYLHVPIAAFVCLPLAIGFPEQQKYAHAWIYQNVIDYNLMIRSEAAPYSPTFSQSINYSEPKTCASSPASTKNIIILMVESLSAYQSQYFSGLNNWTPHLDDIAQHNQAFNNFYANGFITEDGEISLLTGLLPVYPPSSYSDDGGSAFYSFYGITDSVPQVLKKHGYHTEFMTSADLEFGNTGRWANSIGFDYVEGHDHPDYDKWERFHFQAAPDAALYQRVLKRLQQKQQPLFLFIKTVSSHHPYVNPENKHKSEAEAIAYTDKQIGVFYQQLLANGFFNNGLLFIVGDHHSMMPLNSAELALYGQYKASAKVPLIIIGNEQIASTESRQFQQTDVANSIKGLVTGEQCYSDWTGVLLGEHKIPPRYIAHRRGDNRHLVSIFSESAEFLVKLNGDQTELVTSVNAEIPKANNFVNKINYLRNNRGIWATQTAGKFD